MKHVEVIDVDALGLSDSDSDVEMTGFRHKTMSNTKQEELATEGIAYIGFKGPSRAHKRTARASDSREFTFSSSRSTSTNADEMVIVISSDDELPSPPAKRLKRNPAPLSRSGTARSRPDSVFAVGSTSSGEGVIDLHTRKDSNTRGACSDSDGDSGETEFCSPAWDVNSERNWYSPPRPRSMRLDVVDEDIQVDEELIMNFEQTSLSERSSVHLFNRTAQAHGKEPCINWSQLPSPSTGVHVFSQFSLIPPAPPYNRLSRHPRKLHPVISGRAVESGRYVRSFRANVCSLEPSSVVHHAPKDLNAIIQSRRMLVIASAVLGGSVHEDPSPYNRGGTLSVWYPREEGASYRGHVLEEHRQELPEGKITHFSVSDVAADPTRPTTFASAAQDRRVIIWDCRTIADGGTPAITGSSLFREIPDTVKYQPGGSTLAVQCNDGSVYLLGCDASVKDTLVVAEAKLKHHTAAMQWGFGPSENMLFASSVRAKDAKGFHRAFDVVKSKAVIEFDAEKTACSQLSLDPSGEKLYIATEGADASYMLRQYDVKDRRGRKPVQQVALEPFVGEFAPGAPDINALCSSADGIYIAVARQDNWLDVYDARMLQRGPLHRFAHEREGLLSDTYGVVVPHWVGSVPYGTGFLAGGVDGCIRLWDVKRASDDPANGRPLVIGDDAISTFSLGDMYQDQAPLVVGECSGKVTAYKIARGN